MIIFVILFFITFCGCSYISPGMYHTVSEDETMRGIAEAYSVEMDKLVKFNKDITNPEDIRPGQKVYVPGAKGIRKVPVSSMDFVWPVKGKIIRKFGKYDKKRYTGIGIQAEEGSSVVAAFGGLVVYTSERFRSYGKTIILEHDKNYITVYAHNSENLVNTGQRVKAGQEIAKVGKTGFTDVPMLYFEVRYREKPRNPLLMLPEK